MDNQPLIQPPTGSPTPSPNDHLRLLVELLRPCTPELGRRWLAALLLVPVSERERIVAAVEARIVGEYGQGGLGRSLAGVDRTDAGSAAGGSAGGTAGVGGAGEEFTAIGPDRQREGYVERIETTYERAAGTGKQSHAARAGSKKRGRRDDPPRRSKSG